jgi:hypothetical protein
MKKYLCFLLFSVPLFGRIAFRERNRTAAQLQPARGGGILDVEFPNWTRLRPIRGSSCRGNASVRDSILGGFPLDKRKQTI